MSRPTWFDELIADMVDRGVIVPTEEPDTYSKPGAKFKVYVGDMHIPDHVPPEVTGELEIALLAIMEDPQLMGTPVDAEDVPPAIREKIPDHLRGKVRKTDTPKTWRKGS